jgi:hypothetical protein
LTFHHIASAVGWVCALVESASDAVLPSEVEVACLESFLVDVGPLSEVLDAVRRSLHNG